ncbi:DoxX family protein [Chitinophaga sp. Mgbs1]|uniref:DoxX family protein n=1 Tax=Chitinophaga solisilvae TaxID=1233460 RepID=A0A3S1AYJ3_9BACT|nr:DoxX family protein [Chitinophaga solisilvae]
MQQLFATDNNLTGFVLRVTLGLVLFPHAAQKMFGWFGGPGLSGEMTHMTEHAGLPYLVAVLAILVECLGMVLLVTGTATRITAVAIFGLFLGMIVFIHWKDGFFMNWFGKMPAGGEGFEYHLLVLGMCIAIFIQGGGRWSVDRLWN